MTEKGVQSAAPDRVALLRVIDWGRVMKRLTAKASRWGLQPMAAEDLAQDAMTRMIADRGATWDPQADPTGYRCLVRKMDNRLGMLRAQETLRQEKRPTAVDSEKVEQVAPESDRGADGELVSGEACVRNLERLRTRLSGFPVTLALLDLSVREGQLDPRVAATKLGVEVQQIYRAEEQLLRHARRLRSDGSDPDVKLEAVRRSNPGSPP